MENTDNQQPDISKSQSAQQPNFDQKNPPESGEKKLGEFADTDKQSDTLSQQKDEAKTDRAVSLDQRSQAQPGFVGTSDSDSSDEFIEDEREKLSDGE